MNADSQNAPAILKKVDSLDKLEAFLKKKKKSAKDHSNCDTLFRQFIKNGIEEEQLERLLEMFLPKLDVNFQNPSNGNTTPMMYLVSEGLNFLCEQLIKKNGENIDLTLKDNDEENIFFKIINSSNDKGKVNLFKQCLTLLKEDREEEEKKETLEAININGKSLIESSLNIGNSDISSLLLMEGIEPKIKNNQTGDNLLHFAIRGKNPYCLKIVLNTVDHEIIKEFTKEVNKDNETPMMLATKMNLSQMVKQLTDIESGERKNKTIGENNEDEVFDLLSQITGDTTEKVIKTIKNNYYVSVWNKLFLEIIKSEQLNKNYDIELVKKIINFFDLKNNENNLLKDNINSEGEEEKNEDNMKFPITLNSNKNEFIEKNNNMYDPDKNIYFLNYIVAAENYGTFKNVIKIFKSYIETKKDGVVEDNVDNYIFYVNAIIILIEISLNQKLIQFANILINHLNSFLQNNAVNTKNFDFKNSYSTKYLKYLSVNEIINPTTDIKGLTTLFKCNLNLIEGNFEKAQENLSEFKIKFYGGDKEKKKKDTEPIHKTMERLYHFLKMKADYFSNTQFKLNKHMSSFDKYQVDNDSILFYFNFSGIINLKQAHYSYAEYCFKFCKNIIQENPNLYLKYLYGIEFNLSLCYYFTKNYDKAIEVLQKLKNIEKMKNNPYLFYRLALCYIEKEITLRKNDFKLNNENDIVSKIINNEANEEPAFKKRFLLVNQTPSPSILSDTNQNNEKKPDNFNEAIIALKECLLIIKGFNSYNLQLYNTLNPIMNNEFIDFRNLIENSNKPKDNIDDNHFQYQEVYDSAYLNLIFCLIRKEKYSEAIEMIEEYSQNNSSNKYKYILDNYSIEAYLKFGEFDKALSILSKVNFSYENIDAKGTFYNNSNNQVFNEITYRLALYINLIKINILNHNYQEAEKYINSVINILNYPAEKELPSFVINIIIFYFLSIGKNEQAVQVIKYRRIPKFYSN